MRNNKNEVTVTVPALSEFVVGADGLVSLLDDLATFGVVGVTVLDVVNSELNRFQVQLTAQQMAGLIHLHAFELLTAKYS